MMQAEMVNTNGFMAMAKANKYQRMDHEYKGDADAPVSTSLDRRKESMRYVFVSAIFASLNSVLLGYDVGVMSGCIIFIERDLHITKVQQEILIGSLSFVSLLGSLAGGKTSDTIGRKWTIGLAAIVFQTGVAIMAFASSFQVLMIGRLLAGVGIGFGIMIAPVYIVEIAPSVSRGSFTSFPEIFINFGILLGYISNYAFSGLPEHINWRIMLAIGILPSVFIAFALFVIPESPRWLVLQNRVEEARLVLGKITENEDEVAQRLAEIEEAASASNSGTDNNKTVWQELLKPSPPLRKMLIAGVGIQCFQQITGIDAAVYYSPTIFRDAGIQTDSKLLAATIAVGLAKTSFILIAIFLIDRVGRKPLLYISTIGMTFCLFILALSLQLLAHESVSANIGIAIAISAVCGNVAFFSVGIGPICWVMSSEIYPLRLRAQGAALGAVANRVSSGMIAMSFLSLCDALTVAGTFYIFSVISSLSIGFVYFCIPETKGKSLEQIAMVFDNGREWQKSEVEMGDGEHLVQKDGNKTLVS